MLFSTALPAEVMRSTEAPVVVAPVTVAVAPDPDNVPLVDDAAPDIVRLPAPIRIALLGAAAVPPVNPLKLMFPWATIGTMSRLSPFAFTEIVPPVIAVKPPGLKVDG